MDLKPDPSSLQLHKSSYSTHLTHTHTSRMYLPFMIKYLLNRENIIYHTNRLCLIYNTVMYSHRYVLDQEHLKRLFTYYHRAEPLLCLCVILFLEVIYNIKFSSVNIP